MEMQAGLYMRRCLQLAALGAGRVAPNPMVGAVIVHRDRIIGEGYHQYFGGPHAEVNAINAVHERSLLKDSSLFVNLEPCSHHGKTPPCTDLIIKSGIPRIHIGAVDDHELVAGKGIEQLRQNGRLVYTGILEDQCKNLNRFYYTSIRLKRPFVVLKWAQTRDGFVDRSRSGVEKEKINWITDDVTRNLVHKWRSEVQAIMAGYQTLMNDNPRLTLRDWPGRSPVRVVIDCSAGLPEGLNVFDGSTSTIVFTEKPKRNRKNLEYMQLTPCRGNLQGILQNLHERGIRSLFVEGGPRLLWSFINTGLWDEARVLTGGIEFGIGLKAPRMEGFPDQTDMFHNTRIEFYFREN